MWHERRKIDLPLQPPDAVIGVNVAMKIGHRFWVQTDNEKALVRHTIEHRCGGGNVMTEDM